MQMPAERPQATAGGNRQYGYKYG